MQNAKIVNCRRYSGNPYLRKMKKILLLALLFSVSSALHAQQNMEISEKQDRFVKGFIAATEAHNSKKVIKMLDKSYRTEQIAFLNGNKEQFLNELFSGDDLLSEETVFFTMAFDKITNVHVAEIIPLKDGNYTYIFHIYDGEHEVLRGLLLMSGKLGFVGSRG